MHTISVTLQDDELLRITKLGSGGNDLQFSFDGATRLFKHLACCVELEPAKPPKLSVPEILESAADTFRARNKVYGDNYKNVGNLMMAMFPNGVTLKTAEDFNKWHLFELMVVKMTRFANSNLMHEDSIHDLGVYSFMVQGEIKK